MPNRPTPLKNVRQSHKDVLDLHNFVEVLHVLSGHVLHVLPPQAVLHQQLVKLLDLVPCRERSKGEREEFDFDVCVCVCVSIFQVMRFRSAPFGREMLSFILYDDELLNGTKSNESCIVSYIA